MLLKEDFDVVCRILGNDIYQNAKKKGFWTNDQGDLTDVMKLTLAIGEIIEAVRTLQEGKDAPSEKIPGFTVYEEEIADAIIRLMDLAFGRNLRIGEAALAKNEYNKTREYLHGKKF